MVTRIEKFGASWCGPCKVLDRTLEQIFGIEIVKHDVDEEEELANSKGIRNVPVLIYYNDRDEEVKRTVGAVSLGTIMQIVNNNKYENRGRFDSIGKAKQERDRALIELGYFENHGKELSRLPYRKV